MFKKCDFENAIFVKNVILKVWILWKMRFWMCDFCEKCGFESVNFVKNVILKVWICEKCDFESVNFDLVVGVVLESLGEIKSHDQIAPDIVHAHFQMWTGNEQVALFHAETSQRIFLSLALRLQFRIWNYFQVRRSIQNYLHSVWKLLKNSHFGERSERC